MFIRKKLFLIIPVMLMGCGDDSGGGSSSNKTSGRDTSSVSVFSSSELMDYPRADMQGISLCENTTSRFATNDFIIGTNDNVDDVTLKSFVASTQLSFDLHVANMGLNREELDMNNGQKMEICIALSEGSNGAGSWGGIIVGTGRSGKSLDTLLDHELVHAIGDRITGNAAITAYSHRWFDEGLAEMYSGDATLNQSQMIELLSPVNGSAMPNPAEVEHKGAEDVWLFSDKKASYWYPAYNTTLHYLISEGLSKSDIIQVYKNFRTIHDLCEDAMVELYNDTGLGPDINNRTDDPYDVSGYAYGANACFDANYIDNPVTDGLDLVYPNIDLTSYLTLDPFGSGEYVHKSNIFELALNEVLSATNVINYQNLRDNYDSLVTYGYLQ